MLTILGHRQPAFCDRLSRRSFLRVGSLGVSGLSLPSLLRAETEAGRSASDSSIIMIYLPGGPPQHETFDPKPDAPVEIRGAFGPVATSLPGVQFCELMPKLSQMADRFSIVRTLTGMENRHESFQCYTGRKGGRVGDSEPSGGWPTLGSVVSQKLGPGRDGMLPYVDVGPKMGYGPYNNTGLHDNAPGISWPGITGPQNVPFALEGEGRADLILNGIDMDRLGDRRVLLESIRQSQQQIDIVGLDSYQQQAFGILTSSRLAEAMDVEREDPKTRAWYGESQETDRGFGGAPQSPQHLLLARRLIEAGVRCVTVAFGAWDWHGQRAGTVEHLAKTYIPVLDYALSVLLTDLEQRGLLERTSVVVWGEFGRTPRINDKGGRDHWPATQSVLLAGGGIRGGIVLGETDRHGGSPVSRPIHVQEVFATLYHNLGLDANATTVTDFQGRPRYLVDNGRQPIVELGHSLSEHES